MLPHPSSLSPPHFQLRALCALLLTGAACLLVSPRFLPLVLARFFATLCLLLLGLLCWHAHGYIGACKWLQKHVAPNCCMQIAAWGCRAHSPHGRCLMVLPMRTLRRGSETSWGMRPDRWCPSSCRPPRMLGSSWWPPGTPSTPHRCPLYLLTSVLSLHTEAGACLMPRASLHLFASLPLLSPR